MAYGLSQLPASRFLPTLAPTATKIVQALLEADEPMGRSAIVEAAGISKRSYDTHVRADGSTELVALDILESVQVDGRRRWVAHLEPWWSPTTDRRPYEADESAGMAYSPALADVLGDLYFDVDGLLEAIDYEHLCGDVDVEALRRSSPAMARWLPVTTMLFATVDELEVSAPPGSRPPIDVTSALIGRLPPPGAEPEQVALYPVDSTPMTGGNQDLRG